jgi:hypothetical protein
MMLRLDTRRLLALLSLALLLAATAGCQRKEETKETAGKVQASEAYINYFGTPPTVAEGTCFALVGYYPVVGKTEKLSPFPLFLFNRTNQMEIVTEQLLRWGEGWDMGGMLSNPFPPDTQLLSLRLEEDLARVELSRQVLEETDADRQKTIIDVIGHTLAQFEGVQRVMVVAEGELLPHQAERAFMPDPAVLVGPGPPRVLAVAGTWEEGQKGPEEVSVFFDRPVTIKEVRLSDEGGRPLQGEYFQSVFDMAVVLHPADPSAIVEGMPLAVAWQVADRKGRKGKGKKTFSLKRLEHP